MIGRGQEWDATNRSNHVGKPVTAPAAPSTKRSTFGSLRVRNFRLFVAGQSVSYIGGFVQRIAQDWLILSITGSITAVGVTTGLQFAPAILFGLFGGVIADRYPKRRILIGTQAS